MKKSRLVEKDYTRLGRKSGGEVKKGKSSKKSVGGLDVTVYDEFASMGRKERERVRRRWSEKSILRGGNSLGQRSGSKRESNQGKKTVNRGKLERDRGITRKTEESTREKVSKTGMYTRVGVNLVKEVKDLEALEKEFEQVLPPKRRGIGRKDGKNPTRRWLGDFAGQQGKSMGDKDRQGRRGRMKSARTQVSTTSTVGEKLKRFYSRSRRKRLRMQMTRRSRVRVSREKTRVKSE
jgi:hypothetical protein